MEAPKISCVKSVIDRRLLIGQTNPQEVHRFNLSARGLLRRRGNRNELASGQIGKLHKAIVQHALGFVAIPNDIDLSALGRLLEVRNKSKEFLVKILRGIRRADLKQYRARFQRGYRFVI